jgi:hypothetical protein
MKAQQKGHAKGASILKSIQYYREANLKAKIA